MNIEIINTPINKILHGAMVVHTPGKNYGDEMLGCLNKTWPVVKGNNIKNTGINYALYDGRTGEIFAGTELLPPVGSVHGLIEKQVNIKKYAYYKHTGPYTLLGKVNESVKQVLRDKGMPFSLMMEIYGHWNPDESKLETEMLYVLE